MLRRAEAFAGCFEGVGFLSAVTGAARGLSESAFCGVERLTGTLERTVVLGAAAPAVEVRRVVAEAAELNLVEV